MTVNWEHYKIQYCFLSIQGCQNKLEEKLLLVFDIIMVTSLVVFFVLVSSVT